eukprot:1156705-Pelagomonas_calceolata.AAC.3
MRGLAECLGRTMGALVVSSECLGCELSALKGLGALSPSKKGIQQSKVPRELGIGCTAGAPLLPLHSKGCHSLWHRTNQ